jgi:hypothetical protein
MAKKKTKTEVVKEKADKTLANFAGLKETFRPLEKEYTKYGYRFREVKREGLVAMYEQIALSEEEGKPDRRVCFEVFEIIQMPAGFAGPARYPQPAREVPPNSESWGQKGFSPTTREKAEERFQQLIERINNREKEGNNKTGKRAK